jgi:hypothetical protein
MTRLPGLDPEVPEVLADLHRRKDEPVTLAYRAKIALTTAAIGYAVIVQKSANEPESMLEQYLGASEHLRAMALAYAGALGDLAAAERAELAALRRFREGVIALRGEIVAARRLSGDAHDGALAEAAETIDALLTLHGGAP